MSGMKVSANDLKVAADKTEDYYGRIESVQKTLYGEIQGLMATWNGEASRAFLAAFQRFDGEFTQVQDSLSNLHEKLGQTSLTYQQSEAEQTEAGRAVMNMISSVR